MTPSATQTDQQDETAQPITGDELLALRFVRETKIVGPLPVTKRHVRIRTITDSEYSVYLSMIMDRDDEKQRRKWSRAGSLLVLFCLSDENGNMLLPLRNLLRLQENVPAGDMAFLRDAVYKFTGIDPSDLERTEEQGKDESVFGRTEDAESHSESQNDPEISTE